MKLIITGTPGTGKTALAKELAKLLNYRVLNEHDFCKKNRIGKKDKSGELIVPIREFEKKLKKFLKTEKNIILEGHLLCETKLPADNVILLHCNSIELEKRLKKKGYSKLKILENVFCEQNDYCKKLVFKNFGKKTVLGVESGKKPSQLAKQILKKLK